MVHVRYSPSPVVRYGLEGALRRVDRTREELTLRGNALRQEEITEEIEIILLSTGMNAQS